MSSLPRREMHKLEPLACADAAEPSTTRVRIIAQNDLASKYIIAGTMDRSDSIHGHGHDNDVLEPLVAKEEAVVFRDEQDEWKCSKALVWEEVKKQCWIAGPMVSVSLLQYSLRMISVMMVGHLGELALSSASIATSFANVTGFTLLVE